MFGKLLKYDLKSVWRFAFPILIVMVCAGVVGILNHVIFLSGIAGSMDSWPAALVVLASGAYTLLGQGVNLILMVAPTAVMIVVCVDFYQTLVTDQGYLTFTLPVKTEMLIASKVVNAMIWVFGFGIVNGILSLIVSTIPVLYSVEEDITQVIPPLLENVGSDLQLIVGLVTVLGIVITINNIFLYFNAIFLGSVIAKKNKMLAAIGCVLGADFAYGLLLVILISIIVMIGVLGAVATDAVVVMVEIGIGIMILLMAGITVGFYFLLRYMMKNKVNLA